MSTRTSLVVILALFMFQLPSALAKPPAKSSKATSSSTAKSGDTSMTPYDMTPYDVLGGHQKKLGSLKSAVASSKKTKSCAKGCPEYTRLVDRRQRAQALEKEAQELKQKAVANKASKEQLDKLTRVISAAKAVQRGVDGLIGEDGSQALVGEDGRQALDMTKSAELSQADKDFSALDQAVGEAMTAFK